MRHRKRIARWLMIVVASGVLPAFILQCDKAALNFQRGLMQGLGEEAADLIMQQAGGLIVTDGA